MPFFCSLIPKPKMVCNVLEILCASWAIFSGCRSSIGRLGSTNTSCRMVIVNVSICAAVPTPQRKGISLSLPSIIKYWVFTSLIALLLTAETTPEPTQDSAEFSPPVLLVGGELAAPALACVAAPASAAAASSRSRNTFRRDCAENLRLYSRCSSPLINNANVPVSVLMISAFIKKAPTREVGASALY